MRFADALRGIGVINTHDMLVRFGQRRKDDVACLYHVGHRGLAPETVAYSPSHHTDPQETGWRGLGRKHFHGSRRESMPKAIAWATERYGIADWRRCPMEPSNMVPATVLERAREAVRAPEPEGRMARSRGILRAVAPGEG